MSGEYEKALALDELSVITKYAEACEQQSASGIAIAVCNDGLILIESGAENEKILINRFTKLAEREGFDSITIKEADRADLLVLIGRSVQSTISIEIDDETSNDAKVTLERILTKAIKIRASDIHIRKAGHDSCVYYRVDGVLTKPESYSQDLLSLSVSRLINRDISNIKEMSDDNNIENGTVNDYPIKIDGLVVKKELRLSKIPTIKETRRLSVSMIQMQNQNP